MEFYEVLDQVIDLLRSRGRVTYGALKRQFGLDDDFIEDLNDEFLHSRQAQTKRRQSSCAPLR